MKQSSLTRKPCLKFLTQSELERLSTELLLGVLNSVRAVEHDAKQIAVIAGDAIIIEIIVKKASLDSDVPMDWHYAGGQGVVYAKGTKKELEKAKENLWLCLPVHDL